MEEKRKRQRKQVANAERPGRYPVLETFIDDSDTRHYVTPPRPVSRKGKGDDSRAGVFKVHRTAPGRSKRDDHLRLESYRGRCRILDRQKTGYPCATCEGGLDFELCKAIRGVTDQR